MTLSIIKEPLSGLLVVETTVHTDARGCFGRLFCEHELQSVLGSRHVVQINHSVTNDRGAVRGMHYQQSPYAEMKLVRCLKGRVWDVAIDLRKGSSSFLRWHAEELTPDNRYMMVIPEGFAHGFQVLDAGSELLYLHTQAYTPKADAAVVYDDPLVGIAWPLPVSCISTRDRSHPPLDKTFIGIEL